MRGGIHKLNGLLGCIPKTARKGAVCLLKEARRGMTLGGEVCIPGMEMITAKQVQYLEDELDRFNDDLEPLKDFILPGGTRAAALAHQARTICRRAERMIVALAQEESVNDAPRQYLNRLSDLLFVLGRVLNRAGGRGDVLWQKRKNA